MVRSKSCSAPLLGSAVAAVALQVESPVDDARLQMLFDPQTSGGLLIGIAADRAQVLRDALRERNYVHAEIVGEVVWRSPGGTAVVVDG